MSIDVMNSPCNSHYNSLLWLHWLHSAPLMDAAFFLVSHCQRPCSIVFVSGIAKVHVRYGDFQILLQ